MDKKRRRKLIQKLQAQYEVEADAPPVVTLADFFEGNTDEEPIAPNQVDEGRPPLADLYA